MLTFMGQRLVPHLGYRQRQAKLFNHFKTQGNILPFWVITGFFPEGYMMKECRNCKSFKPTLYPLHCGDPNSRETIMDGICQKDHQRHDTDGR